MIAITFGALLLLLVLYLLYKNLRSPDFMSFFIIIPLGLIFYFFSEICQMGFIASFIVTVIIGTVVLNKLMQMPK